MNKPIIKYGFILIITHVICGQHHVRNISDIKLLGNDRSMMAIFIFKGVLFFGLTLAFTSADSNKYLHITYTYAGRMCSVRAICHLTFVLVTFETLQQLRKHVIIILIKRGNKYDDK